MRDHFAAFRREHLPHRAGNQGNAGNRAPKPLSNIDFFGSPVATPPLQGGGTWGTDAPASEEGDDNAHEQSDPAAVDEREAMALEGGVPAVFARAFAEFQLLRSLNCDEEHWHQMINGAALFLDGWGHTAAGLGWTADDLFGPAGLVLRLAGHPVTRVARDHALTNDGRILLRVRRQSQGGHHVQER